MNSAGQRQSRSKILKTKKHDLRTKIIIKGLIWLVGTILTIWLLKVAFKWFGNLAVGWQAFWLFVILKNFFYWLNH